MIEIKTCFGCQWTAKFLLPAAWDDKKSWYIAWSRKTRCKCRYNFTASKWNDSTCILLVLLIYAGRAWILSEQCKRDRCLLQYNLGRKCYISNEWRVNERETGNQTWNAIKYSFTFLLPLPCDIGFTDYRPLEGFETKLDHIQELINEQPTTFKLSPQLQVLLESFILQYFYVPRSWVERNLGTSLKYEIVKKPKFEIVALFKPSCFSVSLDLSPP